MARNSAIEWTENTLSLWSGCTKFDPACGFCYIPRTAALRIAGRKFERGCIPLEFHLHRLEQPRRRRKPTMYFVNHLSDTFHEDVPDEYIARLWATMALCPQHTFQILTKRIERARDLIPQLATRNAEPLPNVWVGTTIGTRKFVHRADVLRETPAAVRFISAEPLLTPLVARIEQRLRDGRSETWYRWHDGYGGPGLNLSGISWLIVGGESGSHFKDRPYRFLVDQDGQPRADRIDWVRDLRDAARASGTAFFMKQMGGYRAGDKLTDLPEDLRIREWPRAVAATG